MRLVTNDYRVGLLSKYTENSVTFILLTEKGEIDNLTLTIDKLQCYDYQLIKMKPDYRDGKFESD